MLLLTGGDDQALGLTLLQLVVRPGSPGGSSSSSGGSGGDGGGVTCRELLRLVVPNAHPSALRSVWASALLPVASSSSGSNPGSSGPEVIVDVQLAFVKDRAISRLTEMQSIEYQLQYAKLHAPQLVLALQEMQQQQRQH